MSCLVAIFAAYLSPVPIQAFSQIPVTIKLTNASVRDVLTALGSLGGVNMIVDDSVTGNITFEWCRVPFESCLNLLTKTKGLSYQTFGNVIVVATPERMTKGFGNVHVIKLQYAKSSEIVDILSIMFDSSEKKDAAAGNAAATAATAASKDGKASAANAKDKKRKAAVIALR